MGVVYEAEDPDLGRRVAIKVLRPDAGGQAVERLGREATAAARLHHPGIVAIHEVGQLELDDGPLHFIVMELIEGAPLERQLAPQDLLTQVAEAIGVAHSQGILHRDLKPANILITPSGRAVVTDFGLAQLDDMTRLTRTGQLMGTAYYMAPEMVTGRHDEIGPAADVWALGVIGYELLTGEKPFLGQTQAELFEQILEHQPPTPPGPLGSICMLALSKEPEQRYASAVEMAQDLQRLSSGLEITARTTTSIWRAVPGRRLVLLLGLLLLLLLLALISQQRGRRALDQRLVKRATPAAQPAPAPEPAPTQSSSSLARQIRDLRSSFYLESVDVQRATRELRIALEQFAEQPDTKLEGLRLLGEGWYLLGNDIRAQHYLLRAEQAAPSDGLIQYLLARVLTRRMLAALLMHDGLSPSELKSVRELWASKALRRMKQQPMSAGRVRPIDLHLGLAYRALAAKERQRTEALCAEGLQRFEGQLGTEEYWLLRACQGSGLTRIENCTQALRRRPHFAWARLVRGIAHQISGQAERARLDYDAALKLNPWLTVAWSNRSLIRKQRGDLKGALADIQRAIALRPNYASGYGNRGNVYRAMGLAPLAFADYEKAIALAPKAARFRLYRGELFYRRKEFARARADFDRCLELDPEMGSALVARALVLRDTGDLPAARRDLDRAIEVDPSPLAYLHRAKIFFGAKKVKAAMADFDRAVALAPRSVQCRYNRGLARKLTGNVAGAIEDFGKVIERQPGHGLARFHRGYLYRKIGRYPAALADLSQSLVAQPKNPQRLYQRAWVYILAKQPASAVKDLEAIVKLGMTRNWSVWANYGLALRHLGRLRPALVAYRKALQWAPKKNRARMAARVRELQAKVEGDGN